MSRAQVLTLPQFADERGSLCKVEAMRDVPFDVKRVYWITSVPPDAVRGRHAHRWVTELLVAVSGSFVVHYKSASDSGSVTLRAPRDALLVPPAYWRDLEDFSSDAVCLVLASGYYDPDDYVDDPSELARLP